jgi:hypothetical protein
MSKHSFGTRASILQNSNKLYSSSFCDWRGVREGAYFQFRKDKFTFNVVNTKLETYSKSFTIKNKNSIICPFNFNPILIKDDNINLIHKELRVKKLLFIINPGSNYRIGDMVFCIGGILNQNYQSGGSFKVISVGGQGEITDLELIESGKYIQIPDNKEIKTYSDGPGQNAELALEFEEDAVLGTLERTVSNLIFDQNETTIIFSRPLPEGITHGELNFSKWLITLNNSYNLRNSNVIGEEYEIHNDLIGGSGLMKVDKIDNSSCSKININFELLNRRLSEMEEKLKLLTQNV